MTGQDGQTTVELAVILPVLLFVLAVLLEIGLIAGDQIRLLHAAREAARVAVVEPDPEKAAQAAEAAGFESLDLSIRPERVRRKLGQPLTVTLVFDRPGRMPLIGTLFEAIELKSEATMRIERP